MTAAPGEFAAVIPFDANPQTRAERRRADRAAAKAQQRANAEAAKAAQDATTEPPKAQDALAGLRGTWVAPLIQDIQTVLLGGAGWSVGHPPFPPGDAREAFRGACDRVAQFLDLELGWPEDPPPPGLALPERPSGLILPPGH